VAAHKMARLQVPVPLAGRVALFLIRLAEMLEETTAELGRTSRVRKSACCRSRN
jgi:hypothetical protein